MTKDGVGWVWDVIHGRGGLPPAGEHLGVEVVSASGDLGEFEARFHGRPEFANLLGGVQGGFLAAMLDFAMSAAVLLTLEADQLVPTLSMNIQYLSPVPLGPVLGRGRVLRRGRTIAFLAGELVDAEGQVLTAATASARIVRATSRSAPTGQSTKVD